MLTSTDAGSTIQERAQSATSSWRVARVMKGVVADHSRYLFLIHKWCVVCWGRWQGLLPTYIHT